MVQVEERRDEIRYLIEEQDLSRDAMIAVLRNSREGSEFTIQGEVWRGPGPQRIIRIVSIDKFGLSRFRVQATRGFSPQHLETIFIMSNPEDAILLAELLIKQE